MFPNGAFTINETKRKPKSNIFVSFCSIEESVSCFKKCIKKFPVNQFIGLTVRFKRNKNPSTTKEIESPKNSNKKQSITIPQSESKHQTRSTDKLNLIEKLDKAKECDNSSSKISNEQDEIELSYDPNKEIKVEEEGVTEENGFLVDYSTIIDDIGSDTDCSTTTLRSTSSYQEKSKRKRKLSSDIESSLDLDSDENSQAKKMNKPKILNLKYPISSELLGEIKSEPESSSSDDDKIEDLEYI